MLWSGLAQSLGEGAGSGTRVLGLGDRADDDHPARAVSDHLVQPVKVLDAADREPWAAILMRCRVIDEAQPRGWTSGFGRGGPRRACAVVGDSVLRAGGIGLLR